MPLCQEIEEINVLKYYQNWIGFRKIVSESVGYILSKEETDWDSIVAELSREIDLLFSGVEGKKETHDVLRKKERRDR